MTLLQAARAYTLGLPLESAYSWGLNRAIFIAAAKRGFKDGGSGKGDGRGGKSTGSPEAYHLGDDMAYKSDSTDKLLFTIGGKIQTKEEFEKRVRSRFGSYYPEAWKEALAYVRKFDRKTLESTDEFFRVVYRPVRDDLADKWTEKSENEDK